MRLSRPTPTLGAGRGGVFSVAPRRWSASLALALSASLTFTDALHAARAQLPVGGGGQSTATPADSSAAQDTARAVEASPQSPRASLQRYLELSRAGRFTEAAEYLDVPDSARADAPVLAQHLKAVLDRHIWFDLGDISPLATGDTADGLQPNVDQVGVIPVAGGGTQPVRMARSGLAEGAPWRFTAATVSRIPGWYADLPGRWALEHLPSSLLRPGPYELLWWQWLAVPLLIVVAVIIGSIVGRVTRGIASRIVARTSVQWDDEVLERIAGPLMVFFALAAIAVLLPWLDLYAPAQATAMRLVRAGLIVVFFWALWRLVDVGREIASYSHWGKTAPSAKALLPLGARVVKVIVAAMAIVTFLSLLGYPVASLIAGLGLGGLAFALAAQKTVENLFGAFSIGVDQPFREGDFVKIEDFVGTVEAIGLRSTRFRTLDRTIVSIPNGRLADMRLESFTARDRLRLATVIGLVYETTGAQMRQVLAGFERVLREHPKIWPDAVVVRFSQFAASSLDIEIMAWFETSVWPEFQAIRQEVLLQFMDVVEEAGTSIAFPTQTVHVVGPAAERALAGAGDGRR